MGTGFSYCFNKDSYEELNIFKQIEMLNVPSSMNLTAKPPVGRSEYGRVKVALPRGKGLMDWVMLTSGKILAKKRLPYVDHTELLMHNKIGDCWILIFGQVYDVTEYLDFHPGGVPELMRAAGRDGTALFNQYHAWVNYESMLKSCLVGQFRGDSSKLPPCGPPTKDNTENIQIPLSGPTTSISTIDSRLSISNSSWANIRSENVSLHTTRNTLRILVRPFVVDAVEIEWVGVPSLISEARLNVSTMDCCVYVDFETSISLKILESPGLYRIKQKPALRYHRFSIRDKKEINHDTLLFELQYPEGLHMPLPLGHHVSMKVKKGAATLYREYTPIISQKDNLLLMIKTYSNGICTPSIRHLDIDDIIELSDPVGDWDLNEWCSPSSDLLVLAAGSGWTPMVNIIDRRIRAGADSDSTRVLYFNKSNEDIVEDTWMPFTWDDSRLKVSHILTRPSAEWEGLSGRLTPLHLEESKSKNLKSERVLICGPDGFVQHAVSLLTTAGYSTDQVHVFQG